MTYFILPLLMIFLSACGSENGNRSSQDGQDPYLPYAQPHLDPNAPLLNGASASCRDLGCETSSVGLLVFHPTPQATAFCTVFAANGHYFTNDHCIPQGLKAGDDCSKDMEVYFPRGKRSHCVHLDFRSGDNNQNMLIPTYDYAQFSIKDDLNLPQLEFDQSGVKENQIISIYKMDFNHDSYTGNIVKDQCEVTLGSQFTPGWNSGTNLNFFSVALENKPSSCHIIPGNSGSPLLNSQNKVVGIMQKAATNETSFGQLLMNIIKRPTMVLPQLGLAGNFACINLPGESRQLSPDCTFPSSAIPDVQNEAVTESMTLGDKTANQFGQEVIPFFQWKIVSLPHTGFFGASRNILYPIPYCIKVGTKLGSEYKNMFGFYKNLITQPIMLPAFNAKLKIDRKLKQSMTFVHSHPDDDLDGIITFSPDKISDGKSSPFELSQRGKFNIGYNLVGTDTLPVCN